MNKNLHKDCCLLLNDKCTALIETKCKDCKFYKSNKEFIRLNDIDNNIQNVVRRYA